MSVVSIKLAIIDDHKLFRKGLISLVEYSCDNVTIIFEADNGLGLQQQLEIPGQYPDIVIMDINMPEMNGFESVAWLSEHHPQIKVLVVSMIDREESIVRMLKMGVKGYLGKDVEPKELAEALTSIANKGYYYTDFITGKLIHSLNTNGKNVEQTILTQLNEREKEFLQLACTELTYNEIAGKMYLSPKTIDGYRAVLFEKLNVKSRVGLALFAVKNDLIAL